MVQIIMLSQGHVLHQPEIIPDNLLTTASCLAMLHLTTSLMEIMPMKISVTFSRTSKCRTLLSSILVIHLSIGFPIDTDTRLALPYVQTSRTVTSFGNLSMTPTFVKKSRSLTMPTTLHLVKFSYHMKYVIP
jgi:hypothetical protein